MPSFPHLKQSFSAGELSREIIGKVTSQTYADGLTMCRNFIPTPIGSLIKRPGTTRLFPTKDNKPARLFSMSFGNNENYLLEFTETKLRILARDTDDIVTDFPSGSDAKTRLNIGLKPFYFNGNDYLESPYAFSDFDGVSCSQSLDTVIFVHQDHLPWYLRRLTTSSGLTWTFDSLETGYKVKAPVIRDSSDKSNSLLAKYNPLSWDFWFDSGAPGFAFVAVCMVGNREIYQSEMSETVLLDEGFFHVTFSAFDTCVTHLFMYRRRGDGSFYNYKVYKKEDLFHESYWDSYTLQPSTRYTEAQDFLSAATVGTEEDPDIEEQSNGTPAVNLLGTFGVDGSFKPRAVDFYQQRCFFAGVSSKPNKVVCSNLGDYSSFMKHAIPIPTDANTFTLAGRTFNGINHLTSINNLIVFTQDSEWVITFDFKTGNTGFNLISYIGSSSVLPSVSNNKIFYVTKGNRVHEISLSQKQGQTSAANNYTNINRSLLSDHLFDKDLIVDSCVTQTPFPIVWFINDQGELLGLTVSDETASIAWHKHVTAYGLFKSCASLSFGSDDYLFLVVKRGDDYIIECLDVSSANVATMDSSTNFIERPVSDNASELSYVNCFLAETESNDQSIPYAFSKIVQDMYVNGLAGALHPVSIHAFSSDSSEVEIPVYEKDPKDITQDVATAMLGDLSKYKPDVNIHIGYPVLAVFETFPIALQTGPDYMKAANESVKRISLGVVESHGFLNSCVFVNSSSNFQPSISYNDLYEGYLVGQAEKGTPAPKRGFELYSKDAKNFYSPATEADVGELVFNLSYGWNKNISIVYMDGGCGKLKFNYLITEIETS